MSHKKKIDNNDLFYYSILSEGKSSINLLICFSSFFFFFLIIAAVVPPVAAAPIPRPIREPRSTPLFVSSSLLGGVGSCGAVILSSGFSGVGGSCVGLSGGSVGGVGS